jgi:hypothetical protein
MIQEFQTEVKNTKQDLLFVLNIPGKGNIHDIPRSSSTHERTSWKSPLHYIPFNCYVLSSNQLSWGQIPRYPILEKTLVQPPNTEPTHPMQQPYCKSHHGAQFHTGCLQPSSIDFLFNALRDFQGYILHCFGLPAILLNRHGLLWELPNLNCYHSYSFQPPLHK